MLELGIGADLVRGFGWWLVAVFLGLLAFAIGKPKAVGAKIFFASLVLVVFVGPLIPNVLRRAEFVRNRDAARAMFEERCRSAGEFIHRKVTDVDGIYLVNARPEVNVDDQFDPNDPAGDSARGEGYIHTFLMGKGLNAADPWMLTYKNRIGAYSYVEVPASNGPWLLHYTDKRPADVSDASSDLLAYRAVDERQARYGVEWADISTREDRQRWIAGSRIRVLDMTTKEVLAERIAYVVDLGQGDRSGFRSPWLFARRNACPPFPFFDTPRPEAWGTTRYFVEKVLQRHISPA